MLAVLVGKAEGDKGLGEVRPVGVEKTAGPVVGTLGGGGGSERVAGATVSLIPDRADVTAPVVAPPVEAGGKFDGPENLSQGTDVVSGPGSTGKKRCPAAEEGGLFFFQELKDPVTVDGEVVSVVVDLVADILQGIVRFEGERFLRAGPGRQDHRQEEKQRHSRLQLAYHLDPPIVYYTIPRGGRGRRHISPEWRSSVREGQTATFWTWSPVFSRRASHCWSTLSWNSCRRALYLSSSRCLNRPWTLIHSSIGSFSFGL